MPSGPLALFSVPVIAVVLAALFGSLLFTLAGFDGVEIAYDIFVLPLVSPYKWPDLVVYAAPLVMIAAGLALCFRASIWNVGVEGQYILGGIGATAVAIWTKDQSGLWILPLMMIAGALAGGVWAAGAALLRCRFGISEVISTLMLTYVAIQVLNYLVSNVWRSPTVLGMPSTSYFGASQTLPPLVQGTLIHYGLVFAPIVAIAAWLAMRFTLFGFFASVAGLSPSAASFAGISAARVASATLLTSGALAGLAGASEVSGTIGKLALNFPSGYGFSAIVVVFLARLNPVAAIPAALMIALVRVGGDLSQMRAGAPSAAAGLFEVIMLVFLLVGDAVADRVPRVLRSARAKAERGAAA